jgi:hypothetical protein
MSQEVIAQAAEVTEATESQEVQIPEAQEEDKYSEKFLRLMNQARAQQKLQAELKAERQKIEEMRKEYDEFQRRKSMVAEDPLEALKLLGTDFDTLTQHLLQQGQQPNEIDLLRKDVEEMKAEKQRLLEQQELEKQEQLKKQEEQVYNSFREDVAKYIESSEYELVKANDGLETVIELMQQDYLQQLESKKPDPTIMSYDEACKKVEEFLESNLDKLLALEKVKKRLNPEQPTKSLFSEAPVTQPRQSSTTTLTNAMKAASEPTTSSSRRPTEQEMFKNAAAMIKFT